MTQTTPKPAPPKTVRFTTEPYKQSIEEELRSDIVTTMILISGIHGAASESDLKTMLDITKASLGRSQMTLHQMQDSLNPDEEQIEKFKILIDLLSDDFHILTKTLKERKRGDIQWNL